MWGQLLAIKRRGTCQPETLTTTDTVRSSTIRIASWLRACTRLGAVEEERT
jgi:hypothetical protein